MTQIAESVEVKTLKIIKNFLLYLQLKFFDVPKMSPKVSIIEVVMLTTVLNCQSETVCYEDVTIPPKNNDRKKTRISDKFY